MLNKCVKILSNQCVAGRFTSPYDGGFKVDRVKMVHSFLERKKVWLSTSHSSIRNSPVNFLDMPWVLKRQNTFIVISRLITRLTTDLIPMSASVLRIADSQYEYTNTEFMVICIYWCVETIRITSVYNVLFICVQTLIL